MKKKDKLVIELIQLKLKLRIKIKLKKLIDYKILSNKMKRNINKTSKY